MYEVRAKVLKLVTGNETSDSDFNSKEEEAQTKKSPWKIIGVGPLRVLKHKTTGATRVLLRSEPRGHIAINKALLPVVTYKEEPNGPYVKLAAAADDGKGLGVWMLQVKKRDEAKALALVLETNKGEKK